MVAISGHGLRGSAVRGGPPHTGPCHRRRPDDRAQPGHRREQSQAPTGPRSRIAGVAHLRQRVRRDTVSGMPTELAQPLRRLDAGPAAGALIGCGW